MNTIRVQIKRLDTSKDVPLPTYETEGASGMDLRAAVVGEVVLNPGDVKLIPTGLKVSIPRGYEAQIRPRSGLALKHGVGMVNTPGTIDSDYRGEIGLVMINWGQKPFVIQRGDRVAQMVISKVCRAVLLETDELASTNRGEKGFGHSGVK